MQLQFGSYLDARPLSWFRHLALTHEMLLERRVYLRSDLASPGWGKSSEDEVL